MKKLFKGLFATALAVGFLAGCSNKVHTVEFYADNVGSFFKEVEVKHNKTVEDPGEPTARKDYDWAGWWKDASYTAEFDFATKIVEDTKVYGKWEFNPEYVPDERTFQLVGDLANTDLEYINWNDAGEEGEDWDVRSYLTRAEDSNLYSITVEIGYLGKFKVKVPGRPWDSDTEFNYESIREEDYKEYLQEADNKNIQVTDAGKYLVEVESTWGWARITRLGDAEGAGVKPTPEPGTIKEWGLVGFMNNWGNNTAEEGEPEVKIPDTELPYYAAGEYYFASVIYFEEGGEFKLRADNSWGIEFGSHENNELTEGAFEQGIEREDAEEGEVGDPILDDNGEEIIDEGSNIKVLIGGYYSVYFSEADEKLIIRELTFALRGDALATEWGEDSEPLALVGEPVVDAEENTLTLNYSSEYTVTAGELKVKFAAIGGFDGWAYAYGDGEANFTVVAGTVTVTLEIVLDTVELTFDGTATVVAK